MSLILACDLGGSSFRAGLIDRSGRITFQAAIPLPVPTGMSGVSETDPETWWTALCQTADSLKAQAAADFATIDAVAISGFTRTQIFLGDDDRVLRPAFTFRDTRAAPMLAAIQADLPPDHPEYGQVNAFHPIARLAWLARAEPETARRLAAVVEPKDYLNLRLTGACTIDPIGSARLIASRDLLPALGLPGILPKIAAPASILGAIQPGLPGALAGLAGKPAVAMGNDTWTSVVGLGALREGLAYNLSGTTEVFGAIAARPAQAEGLMTVDWGGGIHQVGGPSQTGGDTIDWLLTLLGRAGPIGAALQSLLAESRHVQPLLFLPYLQGERVPHWDPNLRGAFIGLNREHGPADCAHAVLEGVAFLNRLVLERAEAAIGAGVTEIRFGGGGAASAEWCQVKADICERPVIVTECDEPGLLGAAICASVALGHFPDLAAGQAALVQTRTTYPPDAARQPHYRALYALFREAEPAVAPVSKKLAAMASPPG
jgi:xylulokinase